MTIRRARRKHPFKGFTLLEVLIYIFIFSLVVGGGLATAFWTYETTARTARVGSVESEADFLFRKLEWASVGSAVTAPSLGASGSTLTFSRDGTTYTFTLSGSTITLQRDSGTPVPLTTNGISASAFSVHYNDNVAPLADSVTVSFTLNGKTLGPKVFYIR